MPLTKVYNRINWENEPSINTPLNDVNMNHIDFGLNEIDNRVITLDSTKANSADTAFLIKNITFDDATGIFEFTRVNNTKFTINTKLEKLAVNFTYDSSTQKLNITLDDGTIEQVDLSELVTNYDFDDSDNIKFLITAGKVKAEIIDGSITDQKLQAGYLAEIKTEVQNGLDYAKLSKSWCAGDTLVRDGESTNNAKYWAEQAQRYAGVASGNAINYRGDYVSTNAYSELDAVYYDGSTWVAKVNNPSSAPAEGADWRYLAKGSESPMQFTTKADYDALPVSKLTDNKLYFIN